MKMKKLKIILLIIAVLFVIITAASVFAAQKAHSWFQSQEFEVYLQKKIKEYGNIHLAFGNRELKLFPIPQVVVQDVDIVVDDVQRFSIQHLSFSISLTSLFSDIPEVDSITLGSPDITLVLPDPFANADPDAPFPDISAVLHEYLLKAQTNVDVDKLSIVNGKAHITFETDTIPEIILHNIIFNADMQRSRLALDLSMRGNFFDGISFKGNADFKQGTLTGNGEFLNMQLAAFLPKAMFEKESVEIPDCVISSKYSLETYPAVHLNLTALNINGNIKDNVRQMDAKFADSQLSLILEGQTIKLSSAGINGLAPKGRLTAEISCDLKDMAKPQIVMDLQGYNLNIKESGGFLGIMDDDARHLFTNILQDGIIPELRFYIACDNFDDIFRYRKFELDFSAQDATIHIFPIRLLLEHVNGNGVLKEGWLSLNGADGMWRTSKATDCNLKLDLNTNDYDFTFNSKIDFDASVLQELLLTVNPKFKNQLLDRLENLQGRVPGSLDIKFANNQEVITVVSEKFNATGTYKIGKLPIKISNALFTYADTKYIEFTTPSLTLGSSKAQGLRYKQDLTPAKVKNNTAASEVSAAVLDISLSQVLPVITEITAENTPRFLSLWQFTSGELLLKKFKLNGVIDNADTWLIDADVNAKDVTAFNKNFADEPFTSPVVSASIKTNGDVVTFNDINAQFFFAKDNEVNVTGRAQTSSDEIVLDLDISAPKIDFDLLLDILEGPDDADKSEDMGVITGKIDFAADNAILFERAWAPVKATVNMTRDRGYLINLDDVALCNITIKGQININDGQIDMRVEPWLTDGQMTQVLPCLSKNLTYADGDISIQGYVTAKGDVKRVEELLNGEFKLYSKQGHIHRFTLLANLLSIINVTEFYKGTLPNFNEQGFDYTELLVQGKITNGNIVISDTKIDSSVFTAVASGNVDVGKNELSIDILVAPFKTVDRVISYIPIIGHIMGDNLIALPFRATGDINDPTVIPLPPDAVGSSLLGILERTLTSPVSIFDNALFDLFSSDKDAEKNPNKQPGAGPPTGEINEFNPSGQNTPTEPEVLEPEQPAQPPGPNEDGWGSTFYGPAPQQGH